MAPSTVSSMAYAALRDGQIFAAGLDVTDEARFFKRHDIADWLSATGCGGAAAAEVRALLAHVAEPDGSAWTDVKWTARALKRP